MKKKVSQSPTDMDKPWYRNFWVWFVIFFPLAAVIGGIVTVVIAVKSPDPLVSDDYYWRGLDLSKAHSDASNTKDHDQK